MTKVKKLLEVKEFIENNWNYYKQFSNDDKSFWIKKICWNMQSHGHLNRFFKKMNWNEEKIMKHIEDVIDLM